MGEAGLPLFRWLMPQRNGPSSPAARKNNPLPENGLAGKTGSRKGT